jgi:SAM-dependent methyltransferase
MSRTTLIKKINDLGVYPQNWSTVDEVDQSAIDAIADELLISLTPQEIIDHNIVAYNASTEEYEIKGSNQKAIPELPMFINILGTDSLVLDLGSGHGRDSLYMVEPSSRENLNKEGMVSPTDQLYVVPLEGSREFLEMTYTKLKDNLDHVPLMIQGDFTRPGKGEVFFDNGGNSSLESTLTQGDLKPVFDGIWSCAAYLIHLPEQLLHSSVKGWGRTLKEGGIFSVSYIPPRKDGLTTKFLTSRSAPGEIKVFSHYTSEVIDGAFKDAGLSLIDSSTGDYAGHGHIQKGFFSNAFYRKE